MKIAVFSTLLIIRSIAQAANLEDFKCSGSTNVTGGKVTVTFSITDRSDYAVPLMKARYGSGALSLTYSQNGSSHKTQDSTFESFEKIITDDESINKIGYDTVAQLKEDLEDLNLNPSLVVSYRLLSPDYSEIPLIEYLAKDGEVIGRVVLLDSEDGTNPFKICK